MSLNTDPYGINNISTMGVSGKRVKVTVDGEDLGTAAEVVVNSQIFGEGNPSVDLKDLTGLADVSFYGHVYRDLRKTNKELETDISYWKGAWEGCNAHRAELVDEVKDLKARGAFGTRRVSPDDEDTAYWHSRCTLITKLATERRKEIEELEASVERLKQSLKDQAEKHKQKQANLQANFDQNVAGQEKVRFLKKENSSLKRENAFKQEHNRELVSELQKFKAIGDPSVEAWKTAYKVQKEQSVARREALERVTVERDQLLADINSFMEDFAEGATAMNRAVEDWNEKAVD